MANKTEDRQGMAFIGCVVLGVGIGMAISMVIENWAYTGVGAIVGAGIGFIAMSFVTKK